jgi:hypothetical protein
MLMNALQRLWSRHVLGCRRFHISVDLPAGFLTHLDWVSSSDSLH